jgi:hypothetical protein
MYGKVIHRRSLYFRGRQSTAYATALIPVIVCLVVCGCGSKPRFEFDDLDLVPVQAELTEFLLGRYTVPIPVVEYRRDNQTVHRNRFQLDFQLFALVSPQEKSHLKHAWELHQGKIRDRVIRVCRSASVDELQEPELATLKAQLADALRPHLGDKEVRQLLITEVVSQEI